ncbi:MAG TPA: polysaccharide biosynthesis tyrosine autokinase [Bacteroidales bacterium]|nr:polysaccharide biosynthesis tyrosine autokinase [Bacteroidales bacterium]
MVNSNTPDFYPEEETIDIKRYISLFLSNWYWFAGALFIALTIAYGINRYSEKVYTVSSTLLIRDDQVGSINSNVESVIPGGDIFRRQQNLKNEMGILKSLSLNFQVMQALKDFHVTIVGVGRRGIVESRIYKSAPFTVKYYSLGDQTPGKRVNISIISENKYIISFKDSTEFSREMPFGERFNERGFDFSIESRFYGKNTFDKAKSNKYYFWFEDPAALANSYRNSLSVSPIDKDASLVTLSISGFVPGQEADYLNKLMEVYLEYGLVIKNETAAKTLKFIDDQLGIISDSLGQAESNLEKYRLANNFFDLSREGANIQNKLTSSENVKATLGMQLQYYRYLSEYLNSADGNESIISPALMGISDQALIKLVNDLSMLQKEKETIGFNLKLDQPLADLMNARINETRTALKENVRNGIATLSRSVTEENDKIKNIESQIRKLPTTERNLIGIQRKFDLNNTVYTYLLEKRAEAGIAKASNVSDNRIIDYATAFSTSRIKPKGRTNLMIAMILGFMFPGALIIIIDFINDKIIDKKDIEKKTKVPVIGYISHSDIKSSIPVIEKPGSAFAESFRSVRTALKFYNKENEVPVIAVSSTISSEGKTFISINLASIIALSGKKVLLVGLDLRKPRLNKIFKSDNSPGMSSYLSGHCRYDEVITQTHVENLYYAASGHIPPNPAELLERNEMKQFIDSAKKEFDYIVIDTPPVAIVTDTMLIAPFVDLNLFIVRQRYTSRGTLEIIDNYYNQGKFKNLALILNDINLSGYYGYGIRYGYSMGYGYKYGSGYYGKRNKGRYGNSAVGDGYYTGE